ncbi:MAG: hypothetical protein ACR2GZ_06265 [Solirubrobacteraceae bacterium]
MALLIVVILIALGVHSCQVSATNSALKDYTNSVSSLIQESDTTGAKLFQELSNVGSGTAIGLQNNINQVLAGAQKDLSHAQGLSAPDQLKAAHQNLVLAIRMRANGISTIANQIQPALGTSTSKDAVNAIAGAMAQFYASDVLYKDYTATAIAGALHGNGIAVGAPNGESISGGQFVPDVQWVNPTFIATELHVSLPGARHSGKVAPGLHGHSLDSVSVAGTTLQTGSPNSITASPPPTFTLNYTNGGTNNEMSVVCSVTVTGTSFSGEKTVPETFAGQHGSCQVTLKSSPTAGPQTVVATIQKVPGEKNTTNNSLSFPVTFK